MKRRWTSLAVAVGAVVLVSCSDAVGGAVDDTVVGAQPATPTNDGTTADTRSQPAPTTAPTPTATTVATASSGPTASPALAPEARASELCTSQTTSVLGTVQNPELDEASGLAASRRHPGVVWAHNDGAENPGLFAIGADGADAGFHPLAVDVVSDVEDIALISGAEHDEILLADIGDNDANRPLIRIHLFAEPDPTVAPSPITDVDVLEFVYPDRPHNAEVLLVDEANRQVVIVTKQQRAIEGVPSDFGATAPSSVFTGPIDGHVDRPIELTPAGTIDTLLLESRTVAVAPHLSTLLGFGGLPTAGDVSPDGSLIALRTYETVWVWPRLAGRTVAESLMSDPCQARISAEPQGEALTFRDGTLVTLSEGVDQDLFELRP